MAKKISDAMKEFGLNDDQILEIALEPRLLDACKTLRYLMMDKWKITMFQAMEFVKKLKEELN